MQTMFSNASFALKFDEKSNLIDGFSYAILLIRES